MIFNSFFTKKNFNFVKPLEEEEEKDYKLMVPSEIESLGDESDRRFANLRGLRWRVNLGVLPFQSSSIDDLRKATAESRRR